MEYLATVTFYTLSLEMANCYLLLYAQPLQSCPTLCDPVDCILPGSSVHGLLQARILEWVAISFSREFS